MSIDMSLGSMSEPWGERRPIIVVIDDDEVFCEVLRVALTLEGFDVWTAPDGPAGLEAVSRVAADAVVLDLNLGQSDGLNWLARFRATAEVGQVPVLVLTAEDGDAHRRRGRRVGADRYLTKPVDMELLVWNLRELLVEERPHRKDPLAGLRRNPTIPTRLLRPSPPAASLD